MSKFILLWKKGIMINKRNKINSVIILNKFLHNYQTKIVSKNTLQYIFRILHLENYFTQN
jgi:hypothetical protein